MSEAPLTEDFIFYRNLQKKHPLIVKGDGIYLWDSKGNKIIDGASGAAVVCLGHNNKRTFAWH